MLSKNELISFFILLSVSSIFSSSAEAINVRKVHSAEAINVTPKVAGATAPIGLSTRTASANGQNPIPIVPLKITDNLKILASAQSGLGKILNQYQSNPDAHAYDRRNWENVQELVRIYTLLFPNNPTLPYDEAYSQAMKFLKSERNNHAQYPNHPSNQFFEIRLSASLNDPDMKKVMYDIMPLYSNFICDPRSRSFLVGSLEPSNNAFSALGTNLVCSLSYVMKVMVLEAQTLEPLGILPPPSSYPLGAAGGDTRRSEEKQLEIAIASSLEEASKQAAKVAREEQEQLERVTAMGLSVLDKSMPQNAAAEAAASSPYPLGAGGGAKISSSLSPDTPYLLEPLSTDMMQAINLIFLRQSSSDGQKVSLNSSTDFDEIYIFQRFIEMCQIPFEREVIEGLKVEIDPYEAFLITLSGKKLL
jgi:hypothetical protein